MRPWLAPSLLVGSLALSASSARATEPFLGEIRITPYNFAPRGWAFCNGQLLSISSNTALFSLLGTTYGGNGKSTFALPNLQGRAPMQWGQGPGLSQRDQGETGGSAAVPLLESQIPAHSHALTPTMALGTGPAQELPRASSLAREVPAALAAAGGTSATGVAGADMPHNNLQPYLTMNFIIALQGIFPQRN
jgi:microcystin-dependent protein